MHERLEATVSGRVQMVMYRDFTQRKASGLQLTGEVRNNPDGTVTVIAEGPREQLEKLYKKLQKGSLLAHVEEVHAKWHPAQATYSNFSITYA